MMAGQQAALGNFLAFTRTQESSADLAGAKYLAAAGVSGKGSIAFFKKLAEPGVPARDLRQGQLRPHPPAVVGAHPGAGAGLHEGSGLEPADRSGARSALPAGQGQADRLRRIRSRRRSNIRKATRASRPIMPALMPIMSAPIPTKRCPRPRRCSKAEPDDPFFLELKGQILLESGKPAEAIAPLREAVDARGRHAADRRDARPRADRDRRAARISPKPSRCSRPRSTATTRIRSPGTSSGSSTTARATSRAPRLRPPSAAISKATPRWRWPAPKWRCAASRQGTPDYLRAQDIAMVSKTRASEGQEVPRQGRQGAKVTSAQGGVVRRSGRGRPDRCGGDRRRC